MSFRIGVKYCGGCSPRYDRVKLAGKIKERLPGGVEFSRYDDGPVDMYLVLAGCKTACVDRSGLTGKPVALVDSDEDLEAVVAEIAVRINEIENRNKALSRP